MLCPSARLERTTRAPSALCPCRKVSVELLRGKWSSLAWRERSSRRRWGRWVARPSESHASPPASASLRLWIMPPLLDTGHRQGDQRLASWARLGGQYGDLRYDQPVARAVRPSCPTSSCLPQLGHAPWDRRALMLAIHFAAWGAQEPERHQGIQAKAQERQPEGDHVDSDGKWRHWGPA